jgi:hypothetical protein
MANGADERIEQVLRDHGEHVSAAEAQKDSHQVTAPQQRAVYDVALLFRIRGLIP